jgi:hypothetical protein
MVVTSRIAACRRPRRRCPEQHFGDRNLVAKERRPAGVVLEQFAPGDSLTVSAGLRRIGRPVEIDFR